MAKKNLEELLGLITKKVEKKDANRESLNLKSHKYVVSFSQVLNEVYDQVIGSETSKKISIPRGILIEPVTTYCQGLYNTFQSFQSKETKFNVNVVGVSDKLFTVFISTRVEGSGDVFKTAIKNRRLPHLKKLREDVYEAVKQHLISTNQYKAKQRNLYRRVKGFKDTRGVVQGGLLDLGHMEGTSVIEKELLPSQDKFINVINSLPPTRLKVAKEVLAKLDFKMSTNKRPTMRDGILYVTVFDQGRDKNSRQAKEERQLRSKFTTAITEVLNNVDFIDFESSPSVRTITKGILHRSFENTKVGKVKGIDKQAVRASKKTYTSSATKEISSKITTSQQNETLSDSVKVSRWNGETKDETPRRQNWSSLLPILNAKLPPRVIANMKYPSLVNRTGTFGNSAKIVNVEQTREGFPTFVFDYERDPYDVFDRTLGRSPWNTPQRDPRALVDKSVRELVREMAIGRFYTRRA